MSYEHPPQALPAGRTSQNTLPYPHYPPPQHPKETHDTQNQLYPFHNHSQAPHWPPSSMIGPAQRPRISVNPYHSQPYRTSHLDFFDYSSPAPESLRFFPPLTYQTPMQPNLPPNFVDYFLRFDQNCQYIRQRNFEPRFTASRYPQNCHTFYNPEPPYSATRGGTNGDQCFTAARNFSPPALPMRGNNLDSFIGDSGPLQTHPISADCQPYCPSFPQTALSTQGPGARANDTNPPALDHYNNYSPTASTDARASAPERDTSPNAAMRIRDPPKFSNRNTRKEIDSVYNKEVINNNEPLAFRCTRDNDLKGTSNFRDPVGNTGRSDRPAIFAVNRIDTTLFGERTAFNTLTGNVHSPNRACSDTHYKNPRNSNLDINVPLHKQASGPSSILNPISVEGENYATMPPLASHAYTTTTHPAGSAKTVPNGSTKNTGNMEANTKGTTTETPASSFNPLDPASLNPTARSPPSIKFKAYKCCTCNTSHYEPFTSDQDTCYNCNHTVCRACYNFWECCNCNTLGRFSNHTCDECGHEKCPRKCLFQIITKEAWLRMEALRATENRGTAEQQRGERMHKLGRIGDSGGITTGGRPGVNSQDNANLKPGTVAEKEEALKSLVSLREKVKASSKSHVASEPFLPSSPSHPQPQGRVSPADTPGSLGTATVRVSSDPGEDGMNCGTPKKEHENSNKSTAQSPQDSNDSPNTSYTASPSTLAESPETPLESPTGNRSHPFQKIILIGRSAPGQEIESIPIPRGLEGRGGPK